MCVDRKLHVTRRLRLEQLIGQFSKRFISWMDSEWFNERAAQLKPFRSRPISLSFILSSHLALVTVLVNQKFRKKKTFSFSPHLIISFKICYHWDLPWNTIWRCSINFPSSKVPSGSRFWIVTHSLELWRHFCFFVFLPHFERTTMRILASSHFNYLLAISRITFSCPKRSFNPLAFDYLLFSFMGVKF